MATYGIRKDGQAFAAELLKLATSQMYGMDSVIRLCIVALYTDGHILLEGNPGLGKTHLVKTLSKILCFRFKRIQFTPDLIPSDIIQTARMSKSSNGSGSAFRLVKGPIFTSLLLADEINRATQKTQAALLEAMAERQVTFNGGTVSVNPEKITLDDGRVLHGPFMVLATQNPIDHEGTYDLPEAQLDRFRFKVLMPMPTPPDIVRILQKDAGSVAERNRRQSVQAVENFAIESLFENEEKAIRHYYQLRDAIRKVEPTWSMQEHITNLLEATNGHIDGLNTLSSRQKQALKKLTESLRFSLGPRAATALLL